MFKLLTFRNDGAFWPFAESASAGAAPSVSPLRRIWQRLYREIAARRAMQSLSSLDDRMLRDIGIDRGEIDHVCRHGRDARLRSSELGADIARWF